MKDGNNILTSPNTFKEVMIADLVSNGQWDHEKMVQIFGTEQIERIIQSVKLPIETTLRKDRLIYKPNMSGNYTVKEGYGLLTKGERGQVHTETDIWQFLWGLKGILPRVQLFL
jgi:hypothetical protein